MRPVKKIKIAIVGAGGKIGKRVLEALWGQANEFPLFLSYFIHIFIIKSKRSKSANNEPIY